MITSFPAARNNNNVGGIMKFFFVPVDDLVSSPHVYENTAIDSHVFADGKDWLTGYFDNQSAKLESEYAFSSKGKIFKTTFTAVISESSAEMDKLLCDMACARFVLIIIDNNKTQRIIGTKENGATFEAGENSGTKFSELPEYKIKFYWESSCIPPVTGEISDIC